MSDLGDNRPAPMATALIASRLNRLVYGPQRSPIIEIARLIDCDIQTAELAMRGIMTRATQFRYSRVLSGKVVARALPAHRDINATGVRESLLRKIDAQNRLIYALFKKHDRGKNLRTIMTWPKRQLLALYIENEVRAKRYWLAERPTNKSLKYFCFDFFPLYKWREDLQISQFLKLGRMVRGKNE